MAEAQKLSKGIEQCGHLRGWPDDEMLYKPGRIDSLRDTIFNLRWELIEIVTCLQRAISMCNRIE